MLCDMRVSNKIRIESLHLPQLDYHSKQGYLQIVAIKTSIPCELKILWQDLKSPCFCHDMLMPYLKRT